ncbi:ABC transporter ATP-binding protein [Facklamia languida]
MIKLFKRLSLKEWVMILLAILLIAASVWIELSIPDHMADITKALQHPQVQLSDIYAPGKGMILLSLLSFFLSMIVVFLSSQIAASFASRLRKTVFHTVMNFDTTEIKHFSVPSLLTRTTNDIVQIQMFIAVGLQVVVRGPLMAMIAMTKIAGKNQQWLTITFIAVLIMLTTLGTLLFLVFPKQRQVQTTTDRLNQVMRESLTGMRVIRAYNAQAYQTSKFGQANDDLTGLNLFIFRAMSLMQPVMMLVSSGLTLAVYWVGAYLISAALFQEKILLFSDMVIFSSYAMQVVIGFMMMTVIFMILPRTIVSANRINEVVDTRQTMHYPTDQQSVQATSQGELIVDQVSFQYPGASQPILQDISFKASKGQTIAFIGATGSGKSTLINLIPRLYDATTGRILLNGHPIQEYSRQALNNLIGYIPQTAILFKGTIASNIDFGESSQSPLTTDQIWEAIQIAQAKEFVASREDQLESRVSQAGKNYSGGQKQRIAIARALARKPEFLIFDDSFSALDYKTDRLLRQVLQEKTSQTTKIIVAQRISTIMEADLILVLDQGRVVGKGTHKELLAHNQVYQEIAYSQLNEEELAHE